MVGLLQEKGQHQIAKKHLHRILRMLTLADASRIFDDLLHLLPAQQFKCPEGLLHAAEIPEASGEFQSVFQRQRSPLTCVG